MDSNHLPIISTYWMTLELGMSSSVEFYCLHIQFIMMMIIIIINFLLNCMYIKVMLLWRVLFLCKNVIAFATVSLYVHSIHIYTNAQIKKQHIWKTPFSNISPATLHSCSVTLRSNISYCTGPKFSISCRDRLTFGHWL